MQSNKHFLTSAALVVVALFMLDAPVAYADTYYFDPPDAATTGNWNDPDNWRDSCGGDALDDWPDNSADIVIICTGNTVTVNVTVDVASITVESTATMAMAADVTTDTLTVAGTVTTGANTLEITSSDGLTINGTGLVDVDSGSGVVILSGGGTSQTIGGTLNLALSGSTLSITSSCTIDGSGFIDGDNNGALIEIAHGVTFTNTANITGMLQITFAFGATTADFVNGTNGSVEANKAGTLEINPNTHSAGAGAFKVTTSASALLKFPVAATGLSGPFTVSNGILDIDANVATTGDLNFTGGKIAVAGSGVYFQAKPAN